MCKIHSDNNLVYIEKFWLEGFLHGVFFFRGAGYLGHCPTCNMHGQAPRTQPTRVCTEVVCVLLELKGLPFLILQYINRIESLLTKITLFLVSSTIYYYKKMVQSHDFKYFQT